KTVVNARPLRLKVSASLMTLSRFSGLDRLTLRVNVVDRCRFDGILSVVLDGRGACIPKRGSGPGKKLTTEPSGGVVARFSFVPMSFCVLVRSVEVSMRRCTPDSNLSKVKELMRLSALVVLT